MATAGKNLSLYDAAQLPNGARYRVGIVVSAWNAEITHALRDGALEVLRAAGVTALQATTLTQAIPATERGAVA